MTRSIPLPRDVTAALSSHAAECARCRTLRVEVRWAEMDRDGLARLLARRGGERLASLLAEAEQQLARRIANGWEHLDEPHAEPPRKPVKAPVKAAVPKVEVATTACPRCGAQARIASDNRLRAHRAPSGTPCPRRIVSAAVLPAAPPVVIPQPTRTAPSVASERAGRCATGSCHECGKAVTGERWFCGSCMSRRL